LPYWRMHDYF